MKDSFYITLFSNASGREHPTNTPSSFRTKLSKRIVCCEEYEVALCELQFPNTLCNVYGRSGTTWIYDGPKNMFRSILPQTYYFDINEMFNTITNDLENKIELTLENNRVKCSPKTDDISIRFSDTLAKQFGFLRGEHEFKFGTMLAPGTPNLNLGLQTQFTVLTNIVKSQLHGSGAVQSLRTSVFDLESYSYGKQGKVSFSRLQYILVSLLTFNEINIDIVDEYGEELSFLGGTSSVVLHPIASVLPPRAFDR